MYQIYRSCSTNWIQNLQKLKLYWLQILKNVIGLGLPSYWIPRKYAPFKLFQSAFTYRVVVYADHKLPLTFVLARKSGKCKDCQVKTSRNVIHGSPFVNKRFSHLYVLFCYFIGKRSQAHIGCIYKADQSHSDYQKVMSSPSNLTLHLPPRNNYNSTGCILFFIAHFSYGAAC